MIASLPSPNSLNGLDWCLIALVVLSALSAFLRGAIRVLFSVVGLFIGVWAAGAHYEMVAVRLRPLVSTLAVAEAVACFLVIFAVMAAISLVAGLLRRTVRAVGLGFADRLLGAGLGLVRGVLLVSVALLFLLAFVPDADLLRNSVLAPYFLTGAHAVSSIVPRKLEDRLPADVRRLLRNIPDGQQMKSTRDEGRV